MLHIFRYHSDSYHQVSQINDCQNVDYIINCSSSIDRAGKEAFINDSIFSFAGCQVGKHIKETSFGTHIADKTIKKIKNIEVWPIHYVHLQNSKHNIDKEWFLSIDIDEGYIKRLFVYSNGYY